MKLNGFKKFGLSYQLAAVKRAEDGTELYRRESSIFPNLFTDVGIDHLFKGPTNSHTFVGTGNTPPTVADTSLAAYLSSSKRDGFFWTSYSRTNLGGGLYELVQKLDSLYPVGTATGIVAEVGTSFLAMSTPPQNTPLSSRALVVDELGNPTTFTVQADEELNLTVFATKIVEYDDRISVISVNGVDYTVTTRPFNLNFANALANGSNLDFGSGLFFGTVGLASPFSGNPSQSEGGQNISQGAFRTESVYVNGSKIRSYTLGTSTGVNRNVGGLMVNAANGGSWQVKFDPPIPKSDLQKFTASFSITMNQSP